MLPVIGGISDLNTDTKVASWEFIPISSSFFKSSLIQEFGMVTILSSIFKKWGLLDSLNSFIVGSSSLTKNEEKINSGHV